MNGYVCFHNQRRVEVYANTSYEAQCKAAAKLCVIARKQHTITVTLAEKDVQPDGIGTQVVHSTAGL